MLLTLSYDHHQLQFKKYFAVIFNKSQRTPLTVCIPDFFCTFKIIWIEPSSFLLELNGIILNELFDTSLQMCYPSCNVSYISIKCEKIFLWYSMKESHSSSQVSPKHMGTDLLFVCNGQAIQIWN